MEDRAHGIRHIGTDRPAGVTRLPGLHELRPGARRPESSSGTGPSTKGPVVPSSNGAIEAGINFFDTANVYSNGDSEEILGRALRDFARRDEVVLATKVWAPVRKGPNGRGLSRKAILSEIDKSLRRLGTDYVDLYSIHRYDYDTPLEETLEALTPSSDRARRATWGPRRCTPGSS